MTDPQNQVRKAFEADHRRSVPAAARGALDKGTSIMLGWFDGEHLTDASLAVWSARFLELAEQMSTELIVSAERSAALRHLLEAKDCAVRAQILTNRAYNRPDVAAASHQALQEKFDSDDRSARGGPGGWSTRIVQDQPE